MILRHARFAVALLCSLLLQSCDPMRYARATAPLVTPIDSVCLQRALTARFGPPSMQSIVEKRTRYMPAHAVFYYHYMAFTQTYPDSGDATLSASEPVAQGLGVLFAKSRKAQDSVSRRLGREVLALRDECGGRAPRDRPELTFER